MPENHRIEIFTAGCPICQKTVAELASAPPCRDCETIIVETQDPAGAERARELGVKRLPAVAVDGKLLQCCASGPIDPEELKQACSSS